MQAFNKPPLNTGDFNYEIKDGILFIERLKRIQFNIDTIKENVSRRLEYTEGSSYPTVIFGKELLSLSKEARGYLASDGAKGMISRAFVVEKLQGKLPLQFFIETTQQLIPVKVFDEIDAAIEWSKQFR